MSLLFTDEYDQSKFIYEHKDYVHCEGGDGTLLRAINNYKHLNKPFFGRASGTVNFLMNADPMVARPTILKFNLLSVKVTHADGVDTYEAFNDVVLGYFNGWVTFDCTHKDNQLGTFRGSGVIVSTAQGSTGINRNNHGTILALGSKRWSVTGMQTERTINSVIKPQPLTIDVTSRTPVSIGIDGSTHVVHNVQSITIRKGSSVHVIFNDIADFQLKRQ